MLWHRGLSPPHCLSKVKTLNPKVLPTPAPPPGGLIPLFWPLGPCFPFILASWPLISYIFSFSAFVWCHFGHLRLGFLSILPLWTLPVGIFRFYSHFGWHRAISILERPLAATDFFAAPPCPPAPSSKRPLAETDFLLARLVASTQLHPQRTLGRNRFFAGPPCGINPAPSSKDPWPKPIFCWPALWHQPSSILKGPLAETDYLLARLVASTQLHPQRTLGRNRFFAGPPCGINPVPSSNDPWPQPIFLLARLVASTQLHPQRTLGRNRFFCWPALWHQPSSILKGPLAETDYLLARLVASTQLHPQRTLGRNRFFAGPPCGIGPSPSSKDLWPKPIFCWPALAPAKG